MKSRFEIKANAEQLIKTNNLWVTIGLIPTIASLLVVTNQVGENMTLNQLNIPLSIVISFFEVGSMLYIYDIVNEHKDIPQGFKNQFKEIINSITQKSFIVYLLVSLYTVLWALIPLAGIFIAIIKGYAYGLAIYLAKDNDQIGYNDAITNSRRLMDGKKQDRFMLSLSFIPWILLSLITMGLANIYVIPYMLAADAIYANEVIKNKN
jgi:integral membrane protein